MNDDNLTQTSKDLFHDCPLLFRINAGYYDPDDALTPEEIAFARSQGIEPLPPMLHHPPIASWGLEIGEGWITIVRRACLEIESQLQKMLRNGAEIDSLPAIFQIKEKFGLRFSIRRVDRKPYPDPIRQIVARVIREAETVCERCGQPGELRTGQWHSVLCIECCSE
jgi:hypothetical protein